MLIIRTSVCVIFVFIVDVLKICLGAEFYGDNDLGQTVVLGSTPGPQRDEVQQEILTLLGLHQKPNPTEHGFDSSAPKFMINLYNTLQSDEGSGITDDEVFHTNVNLTFGAEVQYVNGTDVIMSFVNHASKVAHLRHDKDSTFYFDTSDVSPKEEVIAAEFRLYKEWQKRSRGSDCLIEIFRIAQGQDLEDKILEPEANQTVSWNYEGWINFSIANAVRLWTSRPITNLGLYMRVTHMQKGKILEPGRIGIIGRKGPLDKQAFMVGFFRRAQQLNWDKTRTAKRLRRDALLSRRVRRDTSTNEAENYYHWGGDSYSMTNYKSQACQRHDLYVSFRSLGWKDWIIAPEGYRAFYCGGECTFPLGSHMNATNHAIIQNLVALTKPYEVPKPCCAPTKLSAAQVLYFDDKSNVILKRYKHMIVKACGCH